MFEIYRKMIHSLSIPRRCLYKTSTAELRSQFFFGPSAKRIFMVRESRAMPGEQALQANKEIKHFK